MKARWVRWMFTSRDWPKGMKPPLQVGNCLPQAWWAPSPSW